MNDQSQRSNEVQFKFADDEMVRHIKGASLLDLPEGAIGQICCLYLTEPPGYEVLFTDANGKEFSMVVFEPELEKLSD